MTTKTNLAKFFNFLQQNASPLHEEPKQLSWKMTDDTY